MSLLPLFNPQAPTTSGQPIRPAAQEQPYHPVARASFTSGPDVAPPPQIQAMVVDPVRMNGGILQTIAQAVVVAGIIASVTPAQAGATVVQQEQPYHPGNQFGAGVQGPNVAAPPQIQSVLVRQEQPRDAYAIGVRGPQGPSVKPPVKDFVAVYQELPGHPGAQFRASIQGPNVAAPPQIGALVTAIFGRQEFPGHPGAQFALGIQGPNVRVPVVDRAIVKQEQPDHPPARFWPGVQPANVAAPPQIWAVLGRQEQPYHPPSGFGAGKQGPDVAPPPQIGRAIVSQEQPGHPGSIFQPSLPPAVTVPAGTRSLIGSQEQPRDGYFAAVRPSKVGPNANVAAPPQIADRHLGRQELPDHPGARFAAGRQGPDVRAPVTDRLIQGQEQPAPAYTLFAAAVPTVAIAAPPLSPRARLVPEREEPRQPVARIYYAQVQFVAPVFVTPEIRAFIGSQELPSHPGPSLWGGLPPVDPALARRDCYILVRQELPFHPGSLLQEGVQGPDVRLFEQLVSTGPEQPSHPPSRVWQGVQPANVAAPPQIGRALVGQEQPVHPGSSFVAGVTPKPTVLANARAVIGSQQQPDHPAGGQLAGIQAYTVRSPIVDRALGRQELPDHPVGSFRPGLQGPDVGAPVTRATIGAQEQPSHPASRFWGGVPPRNVAAPPQIGRALTVQEQPFHPGSVFRPSVPPAITINPNTRSVVGSQEQPSHPPARFWPGVPPKNVAAPPQIGDRYLGRQEQPDHPASRVASGVHPRNVRTATTDWLIRGQEQPRPAAWVFAAQAPVPAAAASLASRARLVPEREEPRQPTARMGYVGGIQFVPTHTPDLARTLLTVQEQPAHPGPFVPSRVFPGTVRVQFLSAITKQEQPFHPGPIVWPGIPPTNPPQAAARRVHFQPPQEQPSHPGPLLVAPPQLQNVAVLAARLVPLRQDPPYHPVARPAYSAPAPGGTVPPPPLLFPVATNQQYPEHPTGFLLGGVSFSAAVPVTPDHETPCTFIADPPVPENPGLALSVAKAPGPNVAASYVARIIQGQERPGEPPALLRHALLTPPPPAVFIPPNQRQISTVQPPPHQPTARHYYFNPIPGPLPGTDVGPARAVLVVAQEQSAQAPNIFLAAPSLTAAVPVIGDLETPVSFIPDPPVPETPGLALAAPGVVGNIVVASSVPRRLIQGQEVPHQPRASARYFATRSNVALVPGRLITRQEQPDQKQPVFWARSDNTGPRLDNTVVVRQEQPRHPGNLFGWRAVGNVASGIRSWAITVQELPSHPRSQFFAGDAMLSESTQRGITRSVLARQEQPNHPLPSLYSGVVPANVATGVTTSVLTSQEQPSHPLPATYRGVVPGNVGVGIHSDLVTTQQQPDHPASVVLGFIPATALPAVPRSLVTGQQQPDHPAGLSRPGVQGPNVAPEVRGRAITTQEQPFHPASLLRLAPRFIVGTAVTGTSLLKGQDQPEHPRGVLVPSLQTQTVLPAVARATIGRQEPSLPGALVSWPGVFPRNVAPTIKAIGTAQQAPEHPASRLFAGVRPVDVGTRVTRDWAVLVQEQPAHPSSLLGESIQAQRVKPPVVDSVLGRQEQPFHPGNVFVPALPPPNVATGVQRLLVGPQFPDHPASLFVASRSNDPAPPRGVLIQGQEVPAEPRQWTIVRVEKTVASVIPGILIGRQDQPELGFARTVSPAQTQTIRVAVLDRILTLPQDPDHRPGLVGFAGPPPAVIASFTGSLIGHQEQPDQPGNVVVAGVATGSMGAARPFLVARQDRPETPASFLAGGVLVQPLPGPVQALFVAGQEQPPAATIGFGAGPQPLFVRIASEPRDWVITIQEAPGQPGSMLEGASVFTALVIVPVPTLLGSEPSVTLQGSEPGFTLLGSTPSPKLGGSV